MVTQAMYRRVKRANNPMALLALLTGVGLTLPFTSKAWQQGMPQAYDCTNVVLEELDPAFLTREERIALLDGSLRESIDSYDTCVSAVAQTSGGGSGAGAAGSYAGEQGEQGEQGENINGNTTGEQANEKTQAPAVQERPPLNTDNTQGNGSTPAPRGIVAPKDNDKIICNLLFQEINKATDPDMIEGLKQQYRNYKC